jgi:hypothetical protein
VLLDLELLRKGRPGISSRHDRAILAGPFPVRTRDLTSEMRQSG